MLIYHKNIYDQVTLDVFFTKKKRSFKSFCILSNYPITHHKFSLCFQVFRQKFSIFQYI